nr:hypothetical protein [Tanacetum cinerariifolium]
MPPPKPKKTYKLRQPKKKTTKVPQPSESTDIAADKAVHKEGVTVWYQDTMGDTSAHTRRVKKLEKKHMSKTHKLKRLYKVGLTVRVISSSDDEALNKEDTSKQGRINEIDVDEDIVLVSTHDDVVQDEGIEDVGEEEVVEVVTTAKMLIDIVVDASQVTTALTITVEFTKTNVEDKGKGNAKLIEEPEMLKKRKYQIEVDKELAKKLQAKMQAKIDEEDRLARERAQKKQDENNAMINTCDDIQAKIDVDAQLPQRLHEEEQL